MKTVIFVGPSLPNNSIQQILRIPAEVRKPVQRDDITHLSDEYSIICIIDGIFQSQLAVSAREIKLALDRGKIVIGSSSMGALRAAELDNYGMIGIGEVYKAYKTDETMSDADVALIFQEGTFENITVPLVNIRYALIKAKQQNIIKESDVNTIISAIRIIHFTELTYSRLFKFAENLIENTKLIKLKDFINLNRHQLDIKKQDAIKLVEFINNANKN